MKAILLVVFVALVAIAFGETYFPQPPDCTICGGTCDRMVNWKGWYKCRACGAKIQGSDYQPERVR